MAGTGIPTLAGISEHDATVDGVRLHFAKGPAAGPPLVLLPGQSMPWHCYRRVLPALARRYAVYALDVRGHGQSQHTPGDYSFSRCGRDLVAFLREVVGAPALVAGNSSGGLIALWAAASAPELVRGVLAEDPPLFTTEWPASKGTWVHSFFEHMGRTLPDLERAFATLELPTSGGQDVMSFPAPLAWLLGGAIRRRQRRHPGEPVDIPWLPLLLRLLVRGLSEYDVDFTRACTDGRMYDVDQAAMLAAVRCPVVLVHARSFVHPALGLVGAMGEEHVQRAQAVKPDLLVERTRAQHVVHLDAPRRYLGYVERLAAACGPAGSATVP